jgi:hypothetical protein
MYVTRTYHLRVVYVLSVLLITLATLLGLTLYRTAEWRSQRATTSVQYATDTASLLHTTPPTQFPQEEEVVIIEATTTNGTELVLPVTKLLFEYIEITDSCAAHFEGECVRVRAGPGTDFPVVMPVRNGIVLKIAGKVERAGEVWYKIMFDEQLYFPERVQGEWYVNAAFATILLDEGLRTIDDKKQTYASSTKRIIVNRTHQTLRAYDGDTLFMEEKISTGLELTPTPRGTFTIFRKTPSRYMQGPIAGVAEQYYDLPGVPWNLYFTHGGAVIHGAYWHTSFGTKYSHGCVNLPPHTARDLYYWADLGTRVTVED